jgi:hypothetical protein
MNWKTIIDDLLSAGYTLDRIAKESGMAGRSTVKTLQTSGGDTFYRFGVRLVQMHRKVMRKMKAKEQA